MITEQMLKTLRGDMEARLGAHRLRHTLGVEKEMRDLAEIYLPNRINEAASAGLLHDVTKELSREEQLALCQKYGIEVSEEEKHSFALLHAKTGAFYAREHYPEYVSDAVFSAIYKHTVADKEMSLFDSLLYLADFIEEGRSYAACRALRAAFYQGIGNHKGNELAFLNEIMIKAYDASLEALLREGRYISPKTVLAKESALQARFALQGKK